MKSLQENYPNLLVKIKNVIEKTQQKITKTVNREKLVMCWEIGKMIDSHLLNNNRAEYGGKIFQQLRDDTQINIDTLYQMRNFYKDYPTNPPQENSLTWSHYRRLIAVKDSKKRQYFEDLAIEKSLSTEELQKQISHSKPSLNTNKILKFSRGKLFHYKLVTLEESPMDHHLDCGFNVFTKIPSNIATNIKTPAIVKSVKSNSQFTFEQVPTNNKTTYTYKAFLNKVVDGDTLRVTLDLGFNIKHKEILRLKGINAPEMKTKEGQESATALRKILKEIKYLVIKSNKVDIYGRYVADVFFQDEDSDIHEIAQNGVYLNQLLIDKGLAEIF